MQSKNVFNSDKQRSWAIRPAGDVDRRAARILLPDAVYFGSGCSVLVAESCEPASSGRIIAAAALSPRVRTEPVPGVRVAVHVIPSWRRKGLAAEMLQVFATAARDLGARALFGWAPVEPQSEPHKLWRSLGFTHDCVLQIAMIDIVKAQDYLTPLYQAVVDRGWIPSDAKLIPLRAADAEQVARLHARYLGGAPAEIVDRITGAAVDPVDRALSPALVYQGLVQAFTLVRLAGRICHVDATVVHPALRNGWANLLLKCEGMRWVQQAGATRLLFQTYARHTDTRKLGRRAGAASKEFIEPYRLLVPDERPSASIADPTAPAAP